MDEIAESALCFLPWWTTISVGVKNAATLELINAVILLDSVSVSRHYSSMSYTQGHDVDIGDIALVRSVSMLMER